MAYLIFFASPFLDLNPFLISPLEIYGLSFRDIWAFPQLVKNLSAIAGDLGSIPGLGVGKIPWRRERLQREADWVSQGFATEEILWIETEVSAEQSEPGRRSLGHTHTQRCEGVWQGPRTKSRDC